MLKEKTPNYVNNVSEGFAAVYGNSDNHNQGCRKRGTRGIVSLKFAMHPAFFKTGGDRWADSAL